MKNIIEVKNLTKDYGFNRGVFNISFNVYEGETFGFLGPNGAGKTTTIRHLMGFSKPMEGSTSIMGRESFTNYHKNLKDVGYIPGELAFPAGLNGYEVIKMMQDLAKIYNNERLTMLCELFKLDDKQLRTNTKQMSLGTKRKLAIVTAFMSDPKILILDEPTSGLDPIMQDVFINFIKEEKKRGKTILLSSHIFNEVDQTCDRISIIKEGRIVDTFIANDLKHAKHKFYILRFKDKESFDKFVNRKFDILEVIRANDDNLQVLIKSHDDNIDEVVNTLTKFKLVEFNNVRETLEDYFLKFYEADKGFKGL
jgi:ABC-2 type transport system ATP-binding protein